MKRLEKNGIDNSLFTAEKAGKQRENLTQVESISNSVGGRSYEIIVEGQLDEHWSGWLGGLMIAHDGAGNTLLTGILPDQAALHGVLVQIRDLGLTLNSLKSSKMDAE